MCQTNCCLFLVSLYIFIICNINCNHESLKSFLSEQLVWFNHCLGMTLVKMPPFSLKQHFSLKKLLKSLFSTDTPGFSEVLKGRATRAATIKALHSNPYISQNRTFHSNADCTTTLSVYTDFNNIKIHLHLLRNWERTQRERNGALIRYKNWE